MERLTVAFGQRRPVKILRKVSFSITLGEIVAIVGESGSGKSITALSIMGLCSDIGARIIDGDIIYRSTSILELSEKQQRSMRGKEISIVFQDPLSSLNPVYSIGWQLKEAIRLHERRTSRSYQIKRSIELLDRVGIPDPKIAINRYPHEYSGGMRQRALIAMAIANNPSLLIADEPTTALDVTVQAQILQLLTSLKETEAMSILFITHDLGVVAEIADRVIVMYGGRIVESASVLDLFDHPMHPYTAALLESRATISRDRRPLKSIPGSAPSYAAEEQGCCFYPRCDNPLRGSKCRDIIPEIQPYSGGQLCACHFPLNNHKDDSDV